MNRPLRSTLLAAGLAAAVPAHAYVATAFDASVYTSSTTALDSALGLTGIVAIEDFEDTVLVPGLTANLGTYGSALPNHAWDGLTASAWGNALFTVSLAGIRQFGIGISDNDGGGQTVTVNSHFTLDLSTVPGYRADSSGRATYVLIHAEAGDADITRIAIDGSLTPLFDHLVLSTDSGLPPTGLPEPSSAALVLAGAALSRRVLRGNHMK